MFGKRVGAWFFGVYAGYGFTNLLKETKTEEMIMINANDPSIIDYRGTFDSNETGKANFIRAGVKIAIDFGWCKVAKEVPEEEQLPTVDEEAARLAAEQAFKQEIESFAVHFDVEGAKLKMPEAEQTLVDQLCEKMKADPSIKIVITGHTDNYGDPEQNLRYYGMKRAEALRDYMVKQGVSADQIRCESKGQTEPVTRP